MKFFRERYINNLNKTLLSLGLLLIASPWMILFITTNLIAHHSVFNSVPCWSDELAYWHEILSFSQKGLNFGYNTVNENLPTYLSFGTHGFGAISVYTLFAKIFGWKAYSMVIANGFFMSLAFLILILLVKTSTRKLLYILILTLTFTPLMLYTSTSMTELLNYSVLIVYIGLLHTYLKNGGKSLFVTLLVFCTAISSIRIIYVILILPLLFNTKDGVKFDSRFWISFVLWIVFSSLLYLLNNLFVSPYPGSFLNELFLSADFSGFVGKFSMHFVHNTWNLINPVSENIIQVLQRYFVIFICLICFVKSKLIQTQFKNMEIEYFVVFLILFLFLLINLAAYDVFDWRDYRVLAPVLFGCVLFLTLNDKFSAFYSSLLFNFLGIMFLIISPQVTASFNKDRYLEPLKNSMLNHIEYTNHPTSRFENSIAVEQFKADIVLNIPAGIGISYSEVLSDKLNSKYIFSKRKLELLTYKQINYNKSGYLYQKVSYN